MNSNTVDFISRVFVFNIKYAQLISPFLGSNLLQSWEKLLERNTPREIKKVNNNIEELVELENKKVLDMEPVINDNIAFIKKNKANVDKAFVIYLIKRVKKIESISEVFSLLLDKLKTIVPVKKSTKVKRRNVKYVIDKKGYIYANMVNNDGILCFDDNSFNNEMYLFNEALERKNKLELKIPSKLGSNISITERKRRIYIQAMYALDKSMYDLNKKDVDILYPIDRYYNYAYEFVINLYKERFEYSKRNFELNKLWKETINNYGCNKGLLIYENIYWNFIKRYRILSGDVLKEFKYVVEQEKNKRKNILFKNIDGPIPSVENIYSALASIIIKKINDNIRFYMIDMDTRINASIRYMNTKDIAEFYKVFKSSLLKDSGLSKNISKLQMIVASELSFRNNRSMSYNVRKYLEEEVLF